MKLFHGSDTVVRGPLANLGWAKVDFGQGFYYLRHVESVEFKGA